MRAQVDEYRLYKGRCAGCGKAHTGVLPKGVTQGQLGPRALSLVGVLGTRYCLTQRKIRNLLDQLMGLGFVMFRWHGKGLLVGDKLEGLKRRIGVALERGAQQGLCSGTAKTCTNIINLWPALWSFTHEAVVDTITNTTPPSLMPRVAFAPTG